MLPRDEIIQLIGILLILEVFVLYLLRSIGIVNTDQGIRVILFSLGLVFMLWLIYLVYKLKDLFH